MRDRFQKDPARVAHEREAPREDEEADPARDEGVGLLPRGKAHEHARAEDPERGDRVGQHVEEGAADVVVVFGMTVEEERRDGVHHQSHGPEDDHPPRVDIRRVEPPFYGLVDDEPRHRDEREAADEARQDLEPPVAVRLVRRRRAQRDHDGEVRERDRDEMGQEVDGVVQDREGMAEEIGGDLAPHDERRQEEDPGEPGALVAADDAQVGNSLLELGMMMLFAHRSLW